MIFMLFFYIQKGLKFGKLPLRSYLAMDIYFI